MRAGFRKCAERIVDDVGWSVGYCETLLLYVLALGSPTAPIEPEGYEQLTATFETRTHDGEP